MHSLTLFIHLSENCEWLYSTDEIECHIWSCLIGWNFSKPLHLEQFIAISGNVV